MTDKHAAEMEAAMAIVKAKLAAGVDIKPPGADATEQQRMEWLACRCLIMRLRRRRRIVCQLPPIDPELFAETLAQVELEKIKRTARQMTPAKELMPRLSRIMAKSAREGGTVCPDAGEWRI